MRQIWKTAAAMGALAGTLIPGVADAARGARRRPAAEEEGERIAGTGSADTVRLPYTRGKVYQVHLVPGAPFALELPAGEAARNLWYDNRWWAAESTPGSSRVYIRAIGSADVLGRSGFIHIETDPSDLRISLRVEAVEAVSEAALEIYMEGSALNDPAQRQMRKAFDRELLYAEKHAADKARADFEAWRKAAMANIRSTYEWGGDFKVGRVVDDKVQTFITVPDASDRAVIQFVDKAGKVELVNYELENGTYLIQNRVLRPGEKFRLILGKQQSWVALK